jgi:signal peptidase complex subunit 2
MFTQNYRLDQSSDQWASIEKREEEEDEVVEVYEEIPQPHVIETGDSVKVKQVLDDSTMAAVVDAGFEANYSWENFKLFLMFLSCVFAMLAQFYPMPFPDSRLLLAVCCGLYFIISTVLQCIVVFIDKDTIMFTKGNSVR